MGIISRATKSVTISYGHAYVPNSESVLYHSPWWEDARTVVGISVTHERAMSFVPFFAGVRLIAEQVGRLPLVLYRRTGDDERERATNKQIYTMLHDEPNPEMSAMTFRSALQGQIITRGGAWAEREKDDLGRDLYLWPLRADHVEFLLDDRTGRKFLRYTLPSGETRDLTPDQYLYIPGFGYDGWTGYPLLTLFRESLALGIAAQEFGARFFSSGAAPNAVVTHPKGWSSDTRDNFIRSLREKHEGLTAGQRMAIIEEGVSWQQVGMNLDDAQFLETRKFQKGEMATLLGVPPHLIGDVERSTSWGTGVAEQNLAWIAYGLGAHLERWQQETDRQIVRPAYGNSYYSEFLLDALLSGRAEDRMAVYRALWDMGVINADQIARKENLPVPEDGSGEQYHVVTSVAPAGEAEAPPEPAPVPVNGNGNGQLTEAIGETTPIAVRASLRPMGFVAPTSLPSGSGIVSGALKHLPGRHDQDRHAGTFRGASPEAIAAAAKDWTFDHEQAAVLNADGEVIWRGEGDRDSVLIDRAAARGNTVVHSHPSGASLSGPDGELVASYGGESIVAVAKDGTQYRLEPTIARSQPEVHRAYERHRVEVRDEDREADAAMFKEVRAQAEAEGVAIPGPEWSSRVAATSHAARERINTMDHRTWERAAPELGWKYTVTKP